LRSLAFEVALEVIDGPVDLGLELGVAGLLGKLEGGPEIVRATQHPRPQLDLGPEAIGLAEDVLGCAAVVPEAGLGGARLERGQAFLLAGEVKDAPRSIGSAPPGRGRARRPPRS